LPAKARFTDQLYATSWIKVFTILLFGVVSVAVMAFVGLRRGRERRVPWLWVLYFFVAGVSYMCVEIGLIAKAELFLGSPLYAVAVILALFLAGSGLGAYLQDRLRVFRDPVTLVLPAVAAIAWGVLAMHLCNVRLLSLPLPLKILCAVVCVVPAGTFLGMFYPFGVERVVEAGRRAAVPATYAIATLSSVWGSSWAMTAITNMGFSAVILVGAAGYALTGALYLVARCLRP
jgi:predicted membrane-bound spermidine synthase